MQTSYEELSMKLIDGKGQLGEALKKLKGPDVIIYHTWNFMDKSEKTQEECYEKFRKFVDGSNRGMVFISTASEDSNHYVRYKRKAEKYLIEKGKGFSIRLPNLLGKGICERLRSGEAEPYGTIELMTIEKAAEEIIRQIRSSTDDNRTCRIRGTEIPAYLVKELIDFGRDI